MGRITYVIKRIGKMDFSRMKEEIRDVLNPPVIKVYKKGEGDDAAYGGGAADVGRQLVAYLLIEQVSHVEPGEDADEPEHLFEQAVAPSFPSARNEHYEKENIEAIHCFV